MEIGSAKKKLAKECEYLLNRLNESSSEDGNLPTEPADFDTFYYQPLDVQLVGHERTWAIAKVMLEKCGVDEDVLRGIVSS